MCKVVWLCKITAAAPYCVVGKFQLQVMSGCGHMVHEDNPDKVSYISVDHMMSCDDHTGGKDCSNIFSPT